MGINHDNHKQLIHGANLKPCYFSVPCSWGCSAGSPLPLQQFKAPKQLQIMAVASAPVSYAIIKPSNPICSTNLSHTDQTPPVRVGKPET